MMTLMLHWGTKCYNRLRGDCGLNGSVTTMMSIGSSAAELALFMHTGLCTKHKLRLVLLRILTAR